MTIYQPSEELRPFVRYYWVLESNEPFSVLTFPIGCPQIIFHKKSPLYIPELDISQSKFTISGQVNFPSHIQSDGRLDMIVAVFYPHTIGMFIDTPPSAFYNMEISGYDIENRRLNEIARIIFDCEDHNESIAILDKYLMSKINPVLNICRIGESIKALLHIPSITVSSLADIACLSKRQYERIFSETVGMNPKEYSRVVRFQFVYEPGIMSHFFYHKKNNRSKFAESPNASHRAPAAPTCAFGSHANVSQLQKYGVRNKSEGYHSGIRL